MAAAWGPRLQALDGLVDNRLFGRCGPFAQFTSRRRWRLRPVVADAPGLRELSGWVWTVWVGERGVYLAHLSRTGGSGRTVSAALSRRRVPAK